MAATKPYAGKPVDIVVRQEDGSIAALHNVCRHRGSVICKAASGHASRLVCPYHQWSYAADDGRLVRTTSFAEPAKFDKAALGLFPVAVASWRGCVFVLHLASGLVLFFLAPKLSR